MEAGKVMTLREVCAEVKVSRRAVQGYEKAGLVTASGRNERGYLLYGPSAVERIREIKMYQEFGLSIKEICEVIDAPDEARRVVLTEKLENLKEEKGKVEGLIKSLDDLLKKPDEER